MDWKAATFYNPNQKEKINKIFKVCTMRRRKNHGRKTLQLYSAVLVIKVETEIICLLDFRHFSIISFICLKPKIYAKYVLTEYRGMLCVKGKLLATPLLIWVAIGPIVHVLCLCIQMSR